MAAAVLVAGVFAYIPVEKASTVHTGILAKQIATNSGDDSNLATGNVTIVAGSTLVKSGRLCIKVVDAGANNDPDVNLSITSDNEMVDLLDSAQIEDAGGECVNFTGFRVTVDSAGAGDTVDFAALWSEQP